jgi:hypothetical protein
MQRKKEKGKKEFEISRRPIPLTDFLVEKQHSMALSFVSIRLVAPHRQECVGGEEKRRGLR